MHGSASTGAVGARVHAVVAVVACAVTVALFGISAGARQQPADEQAAALFTTTCTKCHTPDRVLSARKTRTQWEETIDKMTKFGASATDEDFSTILDYVLRHCGKVNVNKAPARDLTLVLGLSTEQGAAIVAYRKANGDFADIDALTKVPGLDAEHLQKNKDSIAY
jgi:competence protein ComEA